LVKQVLWSESIRNRIDSGRPHFLTRASLKALSAGSASVLLDVAATDRPDLIILSPEATDMGAPEMEQFLNHLAGEMRVASSTQNQALSALVFLYREVLRQDFEWMENLDRAKRPSSCSTCSTSRTTRASR